jgi:hypothetical protein
MANTHIKVYVQSIFLLEIPCHFINRVTENEQTTNNRSCKSVKTKINTVIKNSSKSKKYSPNRVQDKNKIM